MRDDTIQLPGRAPIPDRVPQARGPVQPGDLTQEMIDTDWWSDDLVARAGIPIIDVPFVSVGGGIGSFVTVDYLRICGVPTSAMKVMTQLNHPWESYEYLTTVSQIPRGERLRSDSASCPDNIWGFPSYALREAMKTKSPKQLIHVLVEPFFDDYYTPKAGHAFESMEVEYNRINYQDCVVKGQVRMVRRRVGGGYFTILTPPEGTSQTRRVAYRSRYVHVVVGYPGLKFLPDLMDYRETHRDYGSVVNAYEPHEQIYQRLQAAPGTVLVRGGGIVASRVLQRLIDDRDRGNLQTQIHHVFRTYITKAHGPHIWMRRKGGDGWAYQGFNYPKSVWGGQLKYRVRKLEGEDRKKLYDQFGGTNTPKRRSWQAQMKRGRREGWYHDFQGEIVNMTPGPQGTVNVELKTQQGPRQLQVIGVIDCTGLEADIREHRLLADLLDHSGAGRNPLGRLDVERTFEVRGTRSEPGRMYAAGSATLGGYFPGVDTFLGLQIAAQEIADDLQKLGFCKKLGPFRSTSQWWKWARGKRI
jgi:pSer/pThr/pTyr-binding forkhead associated (FHA) protein